MLLHADLGAVLSYFLCMMLRKGLCEVVPAPFIEKVILFLLNYLGTLFENQLNVNGLFLDSQFRSIDLRIRISILKALRGFHVHSVLRTIWLG